MMVLELLHIQGINIHHSGAFIPSCYKVVKLRHDWNLRIKGRCLVYHLDTRSNIYQDDIEVVRDDRLPYKPIKGAMWKIERLLARLIKLVSTTVSGYCQISPIYLSLSLS